MSVSFECYVLSAQVSATGRSLVQRSPTECGMSVCDHETSIMRKVCCARGWGVGAMRELRIFQFRPFSLPILHYRHNSECRI